MSDITDVLSTSEAAVRAVHHVRTGAETLGASGVALATSPQHYARVTAEYVEAVIA
jgi:hypothetical protein